MRHEDLVCKCNELFDYFAVLPAVRLECDGERWGRWVSAGRHGAMGYMERERDDLNVILEGVQTVIVVAVAYPRECGEVGLARCFSGARDYHKEVRGRLKELLRYVERLEPGIRGRAVVDSAPALEKAWAILGGLGWRGRNSLVVTPKGSYYNLGLLLIDRVIDAAPEVEPIPNRCGSCRRCVEACPTGAICDDYTIDVRRCISYLNMEAPRLGLSVDDVDFYGWRKGCDTCQECCPWNKR